MDLDTFTTEAGALTDQLRELIEAGLQSKSLKSEDCQRIHLLNTLTQLERGINSVEPSDMNDDNKEQDEYFVIQIAQKNTYVSLNENIEDSLPVIFTQDVTMANIFDHSDDAQEALEAFQQRTTSTLVLSTIKKSDWDG